MNVALSEVWAKGGEGGMALAEEVVRLCEQPHRLPASATSWTSSIEDKLEAIVQKVYARRRRRPDCQRASKQLTPARQSWASATCPSAWPRPSTPCPMTLQSWARPEGFTVTVRKLKVSAGAGFIVALTGDIMTMPGLPKVPAAERIDIDADGVITGLF